MRLPPALFISLALLAPLWVNYGGLQAQAIPGRVIDHHQHLFSPAIVELLKTTSPMANLPAPITAADLIRSLDEAGIKRAVVHSTAYMFSQPSRKVENDAGKVRVENDWTSRQVAVFPDRLVAFCSVNPLKDYAPEEIARCAKEPNLRRGLKLHFGNAEANYHNADHIARLRRVFADANRYRMAIVVHMRTSASEKIPYGRDEASLFLNELVAAAPNVPIQIAHLAGAGGYADQLVDEALSVFIEARQRADSRTKQLWFDVSSVARGNLSTERKELLAQRIRQIGLERIVYGSDAAFPELLRADWDAFRQLPLTVEEFTVITNNVAPYLR